MTRIDDNLAFLEHVAAPTSSGDSLAQLTTLAEQQARVEAEIAKMEAELNEKREELRAIAERSVPELMDALNLAEFKTASGLKIEVAETIRASIPQATAPRAFAWLRANGHAALIKRGLTIPFGKGEDEAADALVRRLEGEGFDVDDKTAVHPSTLAAFVREKLRDGAELPLDLFGVHRQRVSKIKT